MEYSIFNSVELMLEMFESIDKINISYDRENKIAEIFLDDKYCDFDTTIADIKKLITTKEHNFLKFIG